MTTTIKTPRCRACGRPKSESGRCWQCDAATPEEIAAAKAAIRRENGHELRPECKPWVKGPDPRPAPRPTAVEMKLIEHVLNMVSHLSPVGRAYVAASLEDAS